MKLTELKEKINEALKLNDDYDVRILTDDWNDSIIVDGRIDSGRFYFNIHVDVTSVLCEGYHIENDLGMKCCSICNVYYSVDEECPSCKLRNFKESVKKALLSFKGIV